MIFLKNITLKKLYYSFEINYINELYIKFKLLLKIKININRQFWNNKWKFNSQINFSKDKYKRLNLIYKLIYSNKIYMQEIQMKFRINY